MESSQVKLNGSTLHQVVFQQWQPYKLCKQFRISDALCYCKGTICTFIDSSYYTKGKVIQ